jgi:hypothetical protein
MLLYTLCLFTIYLFIEFLNMFYVILIFFVIFFMDRCGFWVIKKIFLNWVGDVYLHKEHGGLSVLDLNQMNIDLLEK